LAWTIEFDERAQHDLAKLDKPIAKRIRRFLEDRIAPSQDPRAFGHNLKHQLSGLWRYRVGDYRILCQIEDEKLIVLVVEIGHRGSIYD
jgi:mRNA interferase RelE/StbE